MLKSILAGQEEEGPDEAKLRAEAKERTAAHIVSQASQDLAGHLFSTIRGPPNTQTLEETELFTHAWLNWQIGEVHGRFLLYLLRASRQENSPTDTWDCWRSCLSFNSGTLLTLSLIVE